MRELESQAMRRGPEVMDIVASAASRHAAAQGIAERLDAPFELADQLLDIQLATFVGCARGSGATQ